MAPLEFRTSIVLAVFDHQVGQVLTVKSGHVQNFVSGNLCDRLLEFYCLNFASEKQNFDV